MPMRSSPLGVLALLTLLSAGVGFPPAGAPGEPPEQKLQLHGLVLHTLPTLQTPRGGFGRPPSLLATRRALFLAQLYGLLDRIDRKKAEEFVLNSTELEGWKGWRGEGLSLLRNVEDLHAGILCLQHLGLPIHNISHVVSLVASSWDEAAGLFSAWPGRSGDVKSSALALTVAEQVGKLHEFSAHQQRIRDRLAEVLAQEGNRTKAFIYPGNGECHGLAVVSCNYYSVLLAGVVGLPLQDVSEAVATWLVGMQNTDRGKKYYGGFFSDNSKSIVALLSTTHAVATLHSLFLQTQDAGTNSDPLVSRLDENALRIYLRSAPSDLESAYFAHRALAFTEGLTNHFKTEVRYKYSLEPPGDVAGRVVKAPEDKALATPAAPADADTFRGGGDAAGGDKHVVQGVFLRPMLNVTTFGALAHAGLEGTLVVRQQRGMGVYVEVSQGSVRMVWDSARELYVCEESFGTADEFGEMILEFTLVCLVAGLGEIGFDVTDTKQVGYGMRVTANVTHNNRPVQVGSTVGVGTDFHLTVELGNHTIEKVTKGDFNVRFFALDPSRFRIGSAQISGVNGTEGRDLSFSFSLIESMPLPAGKIFFIVEVAQASTHIIHTQVTNLWYSLNVKMVATNITVSKKASSGLPQPVESGCVNLADTVLVEMTPGVMNDQGEIQTYGSRGAHRRHFAMDLQTPSGKRLGSVSGKLVSNETQRYVFEWRIGTALHSLGVNLMKFRFVPPQNVGPPVLLENVADGCEDGVCKEGVALNFTVSSRLHVEKLSGFQDNAVVGFGSTLELTFTIVDELSQVELAAYRTDDDARVFMVVLDKESGHEATCIFQRDAGPVVTDEQTEQGFKVTWYIDANTAQGHFALGLSVQDQDGHVTNLVSSTDGKPWHNHVWIGGPISHNVVSIFTSPTDPITTLVLSSLEEENATVLSGRSSASPATEAFAQATALVGSVGSGAGWEVGAAGGMQEGWRRLRDLGGVFREGFRELSGVCSTGGGDAVFVWVFRLSAGDISLIGARLTARVQWSGGVYRFFKPTWGTKRAFVRWEAIKGGEDLKVASDGKGGYQVSFTVPRTDIRSGNVRLQVVRMVDLNRARDSKTVADQRRREAEAKAKSQGLPRIQSPVEGDPFDVTPIFFEDVLMYKSGSLLHDVFGRNRSFLLLGPLLCVVVAILLIRRIQWSLFMAAWSSPSPRKKGHRGHRQEHKKKKRRVKSRSPEAEQEHGHHMELQASESEQELEQPELVPERRKKRRNRKKSVSPEAKVHMGHVRATVSDSEQEQPGIVLLQTSSADPSDLEGTLHEFGEEYFYQYIFEDLD